MKTHSLLSPKIFQTETSPIGKTYFLLSTKMSQTETSPIGQKHTPYFLPKCPKQKRPQWDKNIVLTFYQNVPNRNVPNRTKTYSLLSPKCPKQKRPQ